MTALMLALLLSGTVLSDTPPTSRPRASATNESARLGAEYFVQKNGATWTYVLGEPKAGGKQSRGKITITSFVDWRAHYSYSLGGKTSGGGSWFARDGAWYERTGARGEVDALVLPVTMSRGSRWQAPASVEKGGAQSSSYEVLALEASVDLPNGLTVEHCLAVLETASDGSNWTHYYAPNVGKVAVRGPDGWFMRLVEFRAGEGHAE